MIGPLAAQLTGPLTALWAAAPPGNSDPASGKGPEWGEAAPIGLLVWLLLGLALFLLIKSMNRNLRKVPASFDNDEPDEVDNPGGHSDGAEPAGQPDAGEHTVTGGGDGPDGDGAPDRVIGGAAGRGREA